ncbi:hypothetical protein [Amycolatopsis sp. 195334CR]|uniref:hypothetical protein n=1 Tax=Amycolatopsis sp. 195334CR TaxID=2814588 RepID=UPI0027DD9A9A|nr:hypothetical protein [Amycolatopsis sp. 195334CR]
MTGLRTDPDGGGEFLLTLTYSSAAEGAELAGEVERLFRAGQDSFGAKFGRTNPAESTDLDWPKRGLPCLNGGDRWAENLLTTHAGLTSQPTAPCCDAIWMDGVPGAFTAVLGPGTPRTRGEYVDLADLDAFAGAVSRIVLAFARVRAPARRA